MQDFLSFLSWELVYMSVLGWVGVFVFKCHVSVIIKPSGLNTQKNRL